MASLEYRLYREHDETFPVLYFYDRIPEEEIAMRFVCDYFVKDGKVYEKTSTAAEASCSVIYVTEANEEQALPAGQGVPGRRGGIRIELREFKENTADYPLVKEYTPETAMQALLFLLSEYLEVRGEEWGKTSAEIDEDRGVYVIYARRIGHEVR